jgi:hypothetical protein
LAQGRLTKTRKDIGLFANLKNQNLYESTDDDFLGIAQILFEETKRMLQMVGVPQEDFRRLMIRVAGGNLEG